jgi:hypothetical protein
VLPCCCCCLQEDAARRLRTELNSLAEESEKAKQAKITIAKKLEMVSAGRCRAALLMIA